MLKSEEIAQEAERIGGVIALLAHGEPQRLIEHFARAIERRVLQELEADAAREVARYRELLKFEHGGTAPSNIVRRFV